MIIPAWVTQYAIRTDNDGMDLEVAIQLYHKWPNGLTDAVTYHSHRRQFGDKEENWHFHINLRVLSKLDKSVYDLAASEVDRYRLSFRNVFGNSKLFLKEGGWEREIDYPSLPTPQIEHRIGAYERRFDMTLERYQGRFRCQTISLGELSLIMDWECLVQERIKRF